MNLEEIRVLPSGSSVPEEFKAQVKETKRLVNNKHQKVSLTDASASSFSALIFGRTDLVPGQWYLFTPGQDNKRREKIRIADEEYGESKWVELKIDGSAVSGPVEGPSLSLSAPGRAAGQARGGPAAGRLSAGEVMEWLEQMATPVKRVAESLASSEEMLRTPHVAAQVVGAGQALLTTMLIDVLRGNLAIAPPEAELAEAGGARADARGEDDIPF